MSLLEELKDRRDRQTESLAKIYEDIRERQAYIDTLAIELEDLDTAIAALEPAPAEPVSDNFAALAEFVNAEPVLAADLPKVELKWNDGFGPAEDADEEDASSDDEDDWDDEPEVHISILTSDPAIEPESGLHGEPEPTELDAEPASVLDNPELLAAVERAEATLAIDAQTCEPIYAHPQPAYVGLQDADLDADYDAMREREKADKPKLHFSIFGERGNRKLEEV